MRKLKLPMGVEIPVLGQGTWRMGEAAKERAAEVKALQFGIDTGMTLIDTAEMYGNGGAEEVTGEAIKGRRDAVFLVTKVLPSNAGRKQTVAACERSLQRLKVDSVDLYLLHWRGNVPLAETMAGFQDLLQAGKIKSFGVSNFDINDMAEWSKLAGAEGTQTNQVLYNVGARGIDVDLIPWCGSTGVTIMAYSPLAQASFKKSVGLEAVAKRHNATVAQIMLAWCLRHPSVFAIPKSSRPERVKENAKAADIRLSPQDIKDIDRDFPAPKKAGSLQML
jgi:diketogulonate reductase-like aldo/keto reductase